MSALGQNIGYLIAEEINDAEIAEDRVTIFPNPSSGKVNIQIDDNQNISNVTVYDLTGRKIAAFKGQEGERISLDLDHLDAGNYIIRIKNGEDIYVRKFIKIE